MSTPKPSYSTAIVPVRQGFTMPETLLHKLVTENRSALGLAVRELKGISIERHKIDDSIQDAFKFIKEMDEGTKKYSRLFCFHSYPAEFDEDEIQPFVPVKDSKGNPLLVVGIDGDFPNYVDTSADGFSEAYKLIDDWLGPRIQERYTAVGNSPHKLFEWLRTEQFAKDFSDQIGHRGSLSFLPTVGELFIQEKNDIGVQGEWGQASNAYGYTEAVQQAATPEPDKVAKDPPAVKRSKWVDDDKPATEPKPDVTPPKVEPKAPTEPAGKVAAELVEEQELEPPKGFHGKKLKGWYREVGAGVLPADWRDRPKIKITVKKAAAEPKTDTAVASAMQNAEKQKQDRERALVNSLPILGGEKLKAVNEFFKRYLGDGSAVIQDPVKAKELEKKLAKFSELLSLKSIRDMEQFTSSFISALVKQHPEAAWLLILEQRAMIRDLCENGDKKLGELTATAQTTTPAQESKASTVSPEPEKKVARGASRWT